MHNSKASLFLMEIMMSILFFTIAAVVCLQLFVKAHSLNIQTENLAKATMIAESVSECYLTTENYEQTKEMIASLAEYESTQQQILIYYDSKWNNCSKEQAQYKTVLSFQKEADFENMNIQILDLEKNSDFFNHTVKKHIQRRAS